MLAIKHRHTNATLGEFDVETIKQAAEKGKANLSEANLYGRNQMTKSRSNHDILQH